EVAVARRVADQHDRDAGLVEDGGGHRVVGGEHGPLLAALLGGGDVPDGDTTGALAPVQRLAPVGGTRLRRLGSRKLRHGNVSQQSSRGTLTASPDRFHGGTSKGPAPGEAARRVSVVSTAPVRAATRSRAAPRAGDAMTRQ